MKKNSIGINQRRQHLKKSPNANKYKIKTVKRDKKNNKT